MFALPTLKADNLSGSHVILKLVELSQADFQPHPVIRSGHSPRVCLVAASIGDGDAVRVELAHPRLADKSDAHASLPTKTRRKIDCSCEPLSSFRNESNGNLTFVRTICDDDAPLGCA